MGNTSDDVKQNNNSDDDKSVVISEDISYYNRDYYDTVLKEICSTGCIEIFCHTKDDKLWYTDTFQYINKLIWVNHQFQKLAYTIPCQIQLDEERLEHLLQQIRNIEYKFDRYR